MASGIEFRQVNPANRAAPHAVTQMVISPLSSGKNYQEIPQTGTISEFLLEMRKDGFVYWVGVAVPLGTIDFSKAQVFFHPTVINGGVVHAADKDYPKFGGGWSGSLQRYVAMQGGQLAGARLTPLVVPFMTMAACSGKAPFYMFATRPLETLNAIMTTVRDLVMPGLGLPNLDIPGLNIPGLGKPGLGSPVQMSRIGVSSFSSGIGAMRLFIKSFNPTGLIAEVKDFDSPFIKSEKKIITNAATGVGRVFSQVGPLHPSPHWMTMPAQNFRNVHTFRAQGPHAQIGWMTFFLASLSSPMI